MRSFVIRLAAVLLLAVPLGHAADAAPAVHPALRAHGLQETPAGSVYLVRSRAPIAPAAGLQVISRRDGAAVVTADPAAVAALRAGGAVVVALGAAREAQAPPALPSMRQDPLIQNLVDRVTWASLAQKIAALQAFGTRHSYTPQVQAAADSLGARFAALGLDVEYHTFRISTYNLRNVVATQVGAVSPDTVVVICAHYDSISEEPMVSAPGADDNASGTAAVLTAAELLADVRCRYSIKYVCFAGEEQGLRGSEAWVQHASQQGMRILAALNFDMIGWWEPGVENDLEIEANEASVWLADIVVAAAQAYTSSPFQLHVYDGAWWGDHAAFWEYGYAALNHEEAWDWDDPDFNPNYHSTQDLLVYLDPGYTVANARIAVAGLATLARPIGAIAVPAVAPAAMVVTAHPNPFNGRVTISVADGSQDGMVAFGAYDLRGRRVATVAVPLVDGRGQAVWDAADGAGRPLPTGAYVLRQEGAPQPASVRVLYAK